MPSTKFILGDGISGLIWKFYNPEYEVISPPKINPATNKPAADPFSRSYMIWLHDCPQTRQLLTDLGWQNVETLIRKSRIGYFRNGKIYDHISEELKHTLVNKKMTTWDNGLSLIPSEKRSSARLSLTQGTQGTNHMNVIDIPHGEILYRLRQRCEVTPGKVVSITDSLIGFGPDKEPGVWNKYDRIVSTIPAPIFQKVYNEGHPKDSLTNDFESLPITFAITRKKPALFDGNYEMIYYDDTVPFTRISCQYNKYCIEFTGELSRDEFIKMFPELEGGLFDFWTIPGGRIKSLELKSPNSNIVFSGRFAKWDHSITTEHVIQEALNERSKKIANS